MVSLSAYCRYDYCDSMLIPERNFTALLAFLTVFASTLAAQSDSSDGGHVAESSDVAGSAEGSESPSKEPEKTALNRPAVLAQPTIPTRIRLRSRGPIEPLRKNGVPYYEEWTLRAGASKLKIPAYQGWVATNANSQFFKLHQSRALVGDQLVAAILSRDFIKAMKTKYISFFKLIWVPQEYAFTLMTPETFAEFKEEIQEEVVAQRKELVKREDFVDFEDYLNFKFGHDEKVEDLVDGFLIRVLDDKDMVVYFVFSEFRFEGEKDRYVEPMIATITYALVHQKLLRIDIKRLFIDEDDVPSLVDYSARFVEDMRRLNALSQNKRRR